MTTNNNNTTTTTLITPTTCTRSPSRRVGLVAAAAVGAGLFLAATACSSDADGATVDPSLAPTSAPPPTNTPSPPSTSPPTTSPPTTSGTPTTMADNEAHRALLSGILESHRDAGDFVGARIALRDPDGTITEVGAGTKTLDPTSGPVDFDMPWNIGSATKTFVAVVVLQLAVEGRLDLDAGIDGYVPSLAGADQITPRQLLQHTSGLGEYLEQPAVQNDAQRQWTPDELVAVAEAAGRFGEPGGPFHYSNTNYIVLGEIIEKVTGNTWADEVRTRIAEPLGMSHTGPVGADRAPGFRLADTSFVEATNVWDPSIGGAAGGLQSTDRDLLLFAKALADGTLLSPETQAAMRAFIPGDDLSQFGVLHGYGLGLEQYATSDVAVIGHMGTGAAHTSFVGYDPQTGATIAVQTNVGEPGPQAIMAIEALTAVRQGG